VRSIARPASAAAMKLSGLRTGSSFRTAAGGVQPWKMKTERDWFAGETERKCDRKAEAGAKNILDHVTGVCADGDHLSMRHVDHAHQAKRDGQAERDDQQNGPETEAAKDRAEEVHSGNVVSIALMADGRLQHFRLRTLVGRQPFEIVEAADGFHAAEDLDGCDLYFRIGVSEWITAMASLAVF